MSDSPLEVARERLSICELWERSGWPGKPGKCCRVPYRPGDQRESGSVFVGSDGFERFHDFKTSDTMDAPALLARVAEVDNSEACRRYIELAGVQGDDWKKGRKPRIHKRRKVPCPVVPERTKPELPAMREPGAAEIKAIAGLRGLLPGAVALAVERGLLKVVNWRGVDCWAVSDASGWNAQFRRMDGKPFTFQNRTIKTLGIPGGLASWPLGILESMPFERVLLVEGTGDLLAAFHFIAVEREADRVAAVCVTGASIWLPSRPLELLAGKRVRIVPHLDGGGAGEEAGLRWQTQLEGAGSLARCFDLSGLEMATGEPVTDLNELAMMEAGELRSLGKMTNF